MGSAPSSRRTSSSVLWSGSAQSTSTTCSPNRSSWSSARDTDGRVAARAASEARSEGTGESRSGRARSSATRAASLRARRSSARLRGREVGIRPTVRSPHCEQRPADLRGRLPTVRDDAAVSDDPRAPAAGDAPRVAVPAADLAGEGTVRRPVDAGSAQAAGPGLHPQGLTGARPGPGPADAAQADPGRPADHRLGVRDGVPGVRRPARQGQVGRQAPVVLPGGRRPAAAVPGRADRAHRP